jgi:adenylate cyclase
MGGKPWRCIAEKVLPLPPAQVWELLSNTEHLNRTIGLPSVVYEAPVVTNDDFYRHASLKLLGLMPVRWKEYPFRWVRHERYSVLRVFEGGLLERVVGGIELQESPAGTVVRVLTQITPRHVLAHLILPLLGRKAVRDVMRYCEAAVALSRSDSASPYPRTRTRSPVSPTHLRVRLQQLAQMPIQQDLMVPLQHHLQEGTDEEVLRMQPYALAETWHSTPREVLRLFLYATKVGLLTLKWEMMCPNCRVPKAEYDSLRSLETRYHCDLCGVDFEVDFGRYVELRFSVHPAVREATDATYCIGGPRNAPHIVAQQYLEPGETQEVAVRLGAEVLRLRALRSNQTVQLAPTAVSTDPLDLVYDDDGWTSAHLAYGPGRVVLRLHNRTSRVLVAVLERLEWDPYATTALQVTTMQEFRDLFAAEVLAPGQEIGVQSLAILFSDLKDSTALYECIGDARAYGWVQRHFTFLIDCITLHQGALVKTIGDAVMAVFPRPEAAVQAALEIQQKIGAFNREHHIDPPLVIKLGVHQGPVIAINANNRLDYFGRTVNIAARVQGESVGGDVVLSADLLRHMAVQQVLKGFLPPRPFTAVLKGITDPVTLYRLTLPAEPADSDATPAVSVASQSCHRARSVGDDKQLREEIP